jgi:hypothetical protein
MRLVLLAAGAVFVLSLLLAAALFMLLWGLRALWSRLTGRPLTPFVMRVDPRAGLGHLFRPRQRAPLDPAQASMARGPGTRAADVEDVEPKLPRD